jgi:hypothetical protein
MVALSFIRALVVALNHLGPDLCSPADFARRDARTLECPQNLPAAQVGRQIPPGAPIKMGLTSISSGLRSGPLWFLPTSCPHLKTFGPGSGPRIAPSGMSDPNVCLGFGSTNKVDPLTSGLCAPWRYPDCALWVPRAKLRLSSTIETTNSNSSLVLGP